MLTTINEKLESVIEQTKDTFYGTGEIHVHSMAKDCLKEIIDLQRQVSVLEKQNAKIIAECERKTLYFQNM